MANGTSKRAVRDLASPVGVPGGTGAPQPKPPGPDRSRPASVGGTEWNCPFPPEADTAQMDEAYVTLQVDVRPDGTPGAVRVVTDPGSGVGIVHNVFQFDRPQKTVVRAPFAPFPRSFGDGERTLLPVPPWFVNHRRAATVGRELASGDIAQSQ